VHGSHQHVLVLVLASSTLSQWAFRVDFNGPELKKTDGATAEMVVDTSFLHPLWFQFSTFSPMYLHR
jgi:hypothetical protein